MNRSASNVYSFDGNLRDLAAELWQRWGSDPLTFSKIILVLPSRRAVKTLQEELQRIAAENNKSAVLLPHIYAATETDQHKLPLPVASIPKAIENVDRRLALGAVAQKVLQRQNALGEGHALAIADSLLPIINELQLAERDHTAIAELDIGLTSQHWQQNKDLLVDILQEWEQQELGLEPVKATQQFFAALGEGLLERHYAAPVIIVNVLNPALFFQRFLGAVQQLPNSCILLPSVLHAGLENLPPAHPDAVVRQLLALLDQQEMPPPFAANAIVPAWYGEVFRPAESLAIWQQQQPVPGAEKLRLLEASSLHQEALCIAIQLRQVVEIPAKTAALVTANRQLADLVQQYLRRWELTANDASGTPLLETPVGTLLCLLAQLSRSMQPIVLLDLLKHPLCSLDYKKAATELDNKVFRKRRVRLQGLNDLRRYLAPDSPVIAVIESLSAIVEPLQQARYQPLGKQLQILQQAAETLTAGEAFKQEAGIAAQQLLQRLSSSNAKLEDFPATVQALLREASISPVWQAHQRLHIWGVQEAVMQPVDLLILGGVNQGSIPMPPTKNPWLNQPMQAGCGFADPEQATGLLARSVVSLWQSPEVLITRSTVEDGTPTLPSPFLARLQAYLAQQNSPLAMEETLPVLATALQDVPTIEPATRPAPAPPVEARPRTYSISSINTLQIDPYGFYAANVLKLRRLDPLDQPPTAQERGQLLHKILEDFLTDYPELPADTAALETLISKALDDLRDDPLQQLFWQQKFSLAAGWAFQQEQQQRRAGRLPELLEHTAEQAFPIAPGEDIQLKAKADRIDVDADDQRIVVDYKTGAPPTANRVKNGQELQLSLEAWLLEQGAFHGGKKQPASAVEYWGLSGKRQEPGKKISVAMDGELMQQVQDYVGKLLAAYVLEGRAFEAADPHQFDDYQQLKRASEWL